MNASRPWLLVSLVAACTGTRPASRARATAPIAAERGHTVATVDGVAITDARIRAVAQAEGLTDVRVALDRAVAEQLLANEATRRGLADDPLVLDTARRGAIQSLLIDRVEHVVRPDNLPASDFTAGMRIRGFELAHGELRATVNVVVLADADAGLSAHEHARTLADAVRTRALTMPAPRTPEAFTAMAEQVLAGTSHRVEAVPPIDAAGRYARGDIVGAYAHATFAVGAVGDVSAVFETPFGAHVVLLSAIEPPVILPEPQVQAAVRDELLWRLRRHELEQYVASLRAQYRVTVPDRVLSEVEHARITPRDEQAP